jgi:hypothetical protein
LQPKDIIEIEAIVIEYILNAMFDHYDSGALSVHDATVLVIVSPVHYENKKLTVFHDSVIPEYSPWRGINRKVRFLIRQSDIISEDSIFDGAIQNLCFSDQ